MEVMLGNADTGNFEPDRSVTRSEMAVIMAKLLHLDFLTKFFGLRGAVLGRNAESHYYHGSLWSLTFM